MSPRRLAWLVTRAGPWIPPLALAAWVWLVIQSDRWPSGDGPHVLGAAQVLALDLRAGAFGAFGRELSTLLAPHPPGAYLPWTLSYVLLGPGRHVHLLTSAGLLWLCWDAIRRLGGGLLGGAWLAATALVWAQSELGGVDLVAAAAASQAVSHLAASDRLRRRPATLAWGAWMGLGFLSKYTFPMFLWAPCLVAGIWVLRERRWRALGEAVLAFLALGGFWFALRWEDVLRYIGSSLAPDPLMVAARDLATGPWYAWENLSWYPAAALDAWGWLGALGLGVALALPRRREALPDSRLLVFAAVIGALSILGQSTQRQDRYLLPAVPLLAAVAGAGRGRAWAGALALPGLAAAALTYQSAAPAPSDRDYGHDIATAGRAWPWPAESYQPVSLDPRLWRVDEALTALRAAHGDDRGTVGLLLDDGRGAPGMGLYLFRAGALGYRWDLATVTLGRDAAGQPRALTFVGPFATDDWPSREFTALYAAFLPGDVERERWLETSRMRQEQVLALPQGYEGRLYRAP